MITSYELEIIRKRRGKRIFWFFVFLFAGFLYFFFQGYYPSMNFSLKEIFSSGGLRRPERDEFVKSFGIINISVTQSDAKILLSGNPFGNNEKKMVEYGDYLISVGKPGYIQSRVNFQINKEKPYFIDKIHLLPRAQYEKIGSGLTSMSKVGTNTWIALEDKTMVLYGKDFRNSVRIDRGGKPIGEGYFLSGTDIMQYALGGWEQKSWKNSGKILKECGEEIQIKNDVLWCPKGEKTLTKEGKTQTGVIQIGTNYVRTHEALISNGISIPLNESELGSRIFIEKDNIWYIPSGGNFIPLIHQKHTNPIPLITTPLDEIRYATWFDGDLLVFGKKGNDTFLVFLSTNNEIKIIPFPDIPLEEVRIEKYYGNIFFKTKTALLFLYSNTTNLEWLINGNIRAFSEDAALYEKDGELWHASWSEETK